MLIFKDELKRKTSLLNFQTVDQNRFFLIPNSSKIQSYSYKFLFKLVRQAKETYLIKTRL